MLINGAFDGTYFYVVSNDRRTAVVAVTATSSTAKPARTSGRKTFAKIDWGAPSLANGVLFVPIDEDLYVLDAETGETLTMFDTGGTIAAGAAAIAQGRLVVQSGLSVPVRHGDQQQPGHLLRPAGLTAIARARAHGATSSSFCLTVQPGSLHSVQSGPTNIAASVSSPINRQRSQAVTTSVI